MRVPNPKAMISNQRLNKDLNKKSINELSDDRDYLTNKLNALQKLAGHMESADWDVITKELIPTVYARLQHDRDTIDPTNVKDQCIMNGRILQLTDLTRLLHDCIGEIDIVEGMMKTYNRAIERATERNRRK